jgi:hypothetical protein
MLLGSNLLITFSFTILPEKMQLSCIQPKEAFLGLLGSSLWSAPEKRRMHMRKKLRLLWMALFLSVVSLLDAQQAIKVAAAANLSYLADPLKAAFAQRSPGVQVEL